jgi:hypothetical protein
MAKKKKSRYEASKNLSADAAMIAAANMLLDAGEIAFDSKDAGALIAASEQFALLADRMLGLESLLSSLEEGNGDESGAQVRAKKSKPGIGFKPTNV